MGNIEVYVFVHSSIDTMMDVYMHIYLCIYVLVKGYYLFARFSCFEELLLSVRKECQSSKDNEAITLSKETQYS